MAYIPDDLNIDDWASPVTIIGTDAIAHLDEAVNDIVTLDPASLVNFINAQMAKIPPYLTVELGKIYAETNNSAVAAAASAAASLASENNSKTSETAAAGSASAANSSAGAAAISAGAASNSETAASNSANLAGTKASEASGSAAAAATSAGESASSATEAETAAAKAEAIGLGRAVLSDVTLIPEPSIQLNNIVRMTQANYNLLTPDTEKMYLIVG